MKAISLWQPWASLWVAGIKIHETRHRPTNHRGPLLVHAAKRLCAHVDIELDMILIGHFGPRWPTLLPLGALVGCVELVSCRSTAVVFPDDRERACGNWSLGRYAWGAQQAYRFCEPIPYIGRQGFFDVRADVVAPALCGRAIAAPPATQAQLL